MKTTPAALHVPELADEPGFIHGFSTLLVGSVGLKHAPDRAAVMACTPSVRADRLNSTGPSR